MANHTWKSDDCITIKVYDNGYLFSLYEVVSVSDTRLRLKILGSIDEWIKEN